MFSMLPIPIDDWLTEGEGTDLLDREQASQRCPKLPQMLDRFPKSGSTVRSGKTQSASPSGLLARTSILATSSGACSGDSSRSPGYLVAKNWRTCIFTSKKFNNLPLKKITCYSGTLRSASTGQLLWRLPHGSTLAKMHFNTSYWDHKCNTTSCSYFNPSSWNRLCVRKLRFMPYSLSCSSSNTLFCSIWSRKPERIENCVHFLTLNTPLSPGTEALIPAQANQTNRINEHTTNSDVKCANPNPEGDYVLINTRNCLQRLEA